MTADFRLGAAARVLRLGGIIAYPTEAVWGIGCDPRNEDALESLLFRLRRRCGDRAREAWGPGPGDLYFASLSSRTVTGLTIGSMVRWH